jgi:hypothetical protein
MFSCERVDVFGYFFETSGPGKRYCVHHFERIYGVQ